MSSQGTCGFTVRTVYCCDICGLEVSDHEKIIKHLADNHKNVESVNHMCVEASLPQQQDSVTSSSVLLLPKKSRRKSSHPWREQSHDRTVSKTLDCKPLVCQQCGRIYKYSRCFERHVKQHKVMTQLTSGTTAVDPQSRAGVTVSHLPPDAVNSSDCKRKLEENGNGKTDNPLNDVGQLELQEVADILDDVLTNVPDDNQLEEVESKSCMAPYCCAECPKRFQTRNSFRIHVTDKHTGWTSVCKCCGQLFLEDRELQSHAVNDHGKVLDDADTELVEPVLNSCCCTVCGFRYQSDKDLARHMMCHNNAIPACVCSMCSGCYRTMSGLKLHIQRVHSGDYPYLCELCGDRFATADERTVHVKQHAPDLCTVCGVRLCRQSYGGTDFGTMTCTVCYLEQLSSRDGVQIAGVSAKSNSATQHYNQASSLPLKYCCTICGVKFAWRSNLRRHVLKHTSHNCRSGTPQHFQCSYCGRVFNQASRLRKHIVRHTEPSESQQTSFSCRLCGQRFLWEKSLVRHKRTAHPPSSACHRIPVMRSASGITQCHSTAADSSSTVDLRSSPEHDELGDQRHRPENADGNGDIARLSTDAIMSGKNDKELVPCPECGAAFFWRSNVMRHIREHHCGKDSTPRSRSYKEGHLQCTRCGRRFSRLSFLRLHLQAHESVENYSAVQSGDGADKSGGGVRSEPMLCSQCGQKVDGAKKLRVHMLRHAGIRPHQCTMCDKSFFVAAQLSQHVSVVHKGNRFICDQCGHEANSKSALKLHSRSVHPVPGIEPSFPCSLCSRRFWSKAALQRHATAHDLSRLSKRKAMCSVCTMVFRHVYNLTHHIQTTHADVDCKTPFACATCQQQFDSGLAFKKHYRSKHRNR